jgi:RHS repeat-associated protein
MNAAIWQSFSFAAGTYTVGFRAAQRGNSNATYQQLQVSLIAANPVASTKNFVWIGNSIAEERDADNVVTRRFYAQGEQISGTSYFYTRDYLGSIRELIDSTGAVRARYDYDPYGYRTKLAGDLEAQFGFTGHYYHQPSSLHFALYRAYDGATGRWLSRDPIEEEGGLNLYRYVHNNPVNLFDPLGLADGWWPDFWRGLTRTVCDPALWSEKLIDALQARPGRCVTCRPNDTPADWGSSPTRKNGGRIWKDPTNPKGNHDRVMPGDPKSPWPAQRKPYLKRCRDGKFRDKDGNPVDRNSPEAHIPID